MHQVHLGMNCSLELANNNSSIATEASLYNSKWIAVTTTALVIKTLTFSLFCPWQLFLFQNIIVLLPQTSGIIPSTEPN